MALLTLDDLAVWLQEDPENEEFAILMIECASEAVKEAASQPSWTASGPTQAPVRARQIAGHLAARSYKNPDSVVADGNIGPIGGDRIALEIAVALQLTQAELDVLEAMAPRSATTGSLWILPLTGAKVDDEADIVLMDDTPSDWGIPMLRPDDLPALTPDE